MGQDINNCILLGQISSNGNIGILIKQNGSYVASEQSNVDVIQRNVETVLEYTLNNGVHTLSANNITLTLNNNIITSRNYIRSFILHNMIKELKIHEL